jgi:hypothetical protein
MDTKPGAERAVPGRARFRPDRLTAGLITAAVALAMTLSACGGGSGTPGVAQAGSATATSGDAPGGSSSGSSLAQATVFARCMRAHGIPDFPDPVAGPGGYAFNFPAGLSPGSAQFQAAEQACKSVEPPGLGTGGMPPAAQQRAFLAWAACIRAHGLPDFPDPKFSSSGVSLILPHDVANSPRLPAAQQACRPKLPARFSGGGQ